MTQALHPSHAPHSVPAIQALDDRLYVVTCISNPARYHARYRLYRTFAKHVQDSGAELYTIEVAYGQRAWEVTETGNPNHVQLRTTEELWHKENLQNLALARLPATARYVAFVDADFTFLRPDWAQETMQTLQHHPVVQMFSSVSYVNAQDEITNSAPGWVASWLSGEPMQAKGQCVRNELFGQTIISNDYGTAGRTHLGAPGGAWAWRIADLSKVGGLLDFSILGSGDWHMAAGLIGAMELTLLDTYQPSFNDMLLNWQARAERVVKRNVGLVRGTAVHHYHGPMVKRNYQARKTILAKHQFDPRKDISRDHQGLWQWNDDNTPRMWALRDDVRAYFRSRDEDK